MSNHNRFWGARFGGESTTKGFIFPVKQLSSGVSISGPHQIAPEPNSPRAKQAERDRKEFALRGIPTIVYNGRGKRVAGPIWSVK